MPFSRTLARRETQSRPEFEFGLPGPSSMTIIITPQAPLKDNILIFSVADAYAAKTSFVQMRDDFWLGF